MQHSESGGWAWLALSCHGRPVPALCLHVQAQERRATLWAPDLELGCLQASGAVWAGSGRCHRGSREGSRSRASIFSGNFGCLT